MVYQLGVYLVYYDCKFYLKYSLSISYITIKLSVSGNKLPLTINQWEKTLDKLNSQKEEVQ